jgi:hypothetical protein
MSENPLKLKFNEWSEWLDGNLPDSQVDRNSISGVIYSLVQEMAIYEAYKAVCKANPKSHLATPLFWRSKTFSYFETQSMNIRKLTEDNPRPIFVNQKNKDVYSMGRLITDIRQQTNNGTLTRNNLCIVYEIPPTKEETQRQYDEYLQSLGSGAGSFSVDLVHAVRQHNTLDVICHNNGKLKPKLITDLANRILPENNESVKAIKNFTDKYIAHSASQESREELQKEAALDTKVVNEAIKGLVECFYFFELFVKRAGYAGLIPVGWDTYLDNLSADEKKLVMEVFKDVENKCKEWEKTALTWFGINT